MANSKYIGIYSMMEDNVWYAAKELGVAPATMTALANRDLVEKTDTTPRKYCKKNSILARILVVLDKFEFDYFTLYKSNEKLGMMCSMKNDKVYDCWDKLYDLENVCKIWVCDKEIDI